MTPDQVREIALSSYPEFEINKRNNPDGWAFWVPGKDHKRPTARIFRAIERSQGSEIKWVLSGTKEQWQGSAEELSIRIRKEIDLWEKGNAPSGDQIPNGITSQNILDAIKALQQGHKHAFGDSTGYDVLYQGKRYAPKAVVGFASKFRTGMQLGPYDFKGGLDSKCFRVLEKNGFEVVTKGDKNPFPDEIDETEIHTEGTVAQVLVNRYERDPKARKKCIVEYGAICQVCDMDFEATYGTIGEGFIHVHHIKQISDVGEAYEIDPVKDLIPVCPNCHAMLHKRRPPFSIEELKNILNERPA